MEIVQTKKRRQRKALLVLPVVIIPFLTIAFWALGGGKGVSGIAQAPLTGLNVHLPDPLLKEAAGQDKLSFYREAEKEMAKGGGQTGLAPYQPAPEALSPYDKPVFDPAPYRPGEGTDANEEKVYRKLAQLQQRLQSPAPVPASLPKTDQPLRQPPESVPPRVPGGTADEDPQLSQLNSMMDKILDIQHPERVKEKARPAGQAAGYTVTKNNLQDNTTLLQGALPHGRPTTDQDGLLARAFYSLEDPTPVQKQATLQALVHGTQTLESGAMILLRLVDAVTVNGLQLPKGHLVYGVATLDGERLKIRIGNLRHGNDLIPVRLNAYDLDGMEGLYIPGVGRREAAKGITQRAVQGISLNTFGLPPGVQAAGVGLEAAKNLVSRKGRTARVTVKQGHQLLLQNE